MRDYQRLRIVSHPRHELLEWHPQLRRELPDTGWRAAYRRVLAVGVGVSVVTVSIGLGWIAARLITALGGL